MLKLIRKKYEAKRAKSIKIRIKLVYELSKESIYDIRKHFL